MGKISSQRYEEPFVKGRKEKNGDDEKSRKRTRRNKQGAKLSLHEGCLLNGESGHLRIDCPEKDACGPNGDESQYHFHLFNFHYSGYYPRVVFVASSRDVVFYN